MRNLIEGIRSPRKPLVVVPDFQPFESLDKYIFKMTDGENIVAAKIFKDARDWVVPVSYRVRQEIGVNKLLQRTPLGIYVPEYLYSLVGEDDELLGLAVRWENGISLDNIGDQHPFSQKEYDVFEEAVLSTIDMGVIPSIGAISEDNVMFGSKRAPRLWLAGAEIETERFHYRVDGYVDSYSSAMEAIREYIGK